MMNRSELSDKALWGAIVQNDERAFAALYDRHWRPIYKTIYYYLKDDAFSEQVLHDLFVVLWKRRAHLQINNFPAYFKTAARYHVYSYLRALKVSPIRYIENYTGEQTHVTFSEAESRLDLSDLKDELARQLAELPKRCAEIFWLSRVEQLSNDEIAAKLGISRRTVENQISAASKHLMQTLTQVPVVIMLICLSASIK